jgi:arsenate reductase
MARPWDVLFLCTGNSARSILAEAALDRIGQERFVAYSAGSRPKGAVHPLALELLEAEGFPVERLRSKSWSEFDCPDAPRMDFIFTVCDAAAAEACPVWPGRPATAHWGLPDPAAVEGPIERRRQAFRDTLRALETRIRAFVALDLERLDPDALVAALRRIGRDA